MTDETTRVRRLPEYQDLDRAALDAILDAALVAHVAIVEDGQPFVLPMAVARDGDRILLHGSTGSRLMRALASGTPACVSVTHLDGLVYARSAFESSMNYRSATILGTASAVAEVQKAADLETLTEHLFPGRWAELRAPQKRELAATLLVEMPLETWSVKAHSGPPDDKPEDLAATIWAGVVPLAVAAGTPQDAPDLAAPTAVPAHVLERWSTGSPA